MKGRMKWWEANKNEKWKDGNVKKNNVERGDREKQGMRRGERSEARKEGSKQMRVKEGKETWK